MVSDLVITTQAIVMALSANYEVQHWQISLDTCHGRCHFFRVSELCFTSFYILELVLKLPVHRQYYFCNADKAWSWFDFLMVLHGLYDQLMVFVLTSGANRVNLTFMRIV